MEELAYSAAPLARRWQWYAVHWTAVLLPWVLGFMLATGALSRFG